MVLDCVSNPLLYTHVLCMFARLIVHAQYHMGKILYMNFVFYMFFMRDEKEERKEQARSNKQQGKANTAHPRQSLFLRKNELAQLGGTREPMTVMTLYTLDRALYH